VVPVSMIWPLKVNRSTMAAKSLGSVKVLVQPENGSLEAIAMADLSSRSVRTWNNSGPAAVQLEVYARSSATRT
jgi:hypothetical protein